jgi:Putative phage tail protein
MSGLFGSRQKGIKPDYTGLQVQTSVSALPIPIVWGASKIAPNLLWYGAFATATVHAGGGKGGLFSSPATGYNYSASLVMGLCEGPIAGIGTIWKDQSTYTLADLDLNLYLGSTPQSVWPYLQTAFPEQALAYQGTAYIAGENYALGDSATIDNHNFEVQGALYGSSFNGVDGDPAQVVNDFLTNPQYGVGFPAASIDATTLYGPGGDGSYQTYCKAVGLALSPALTDQETASSILARWLQLTNTAAVWSGGQLKFIPYGDSAIIASDATISEVHEIPIPTPPDTGPTPLPTVMVTFAPQFISNGAVVYTDTGEALTLVSANPATGQYSYAGGIYTFSTGDQANDVTITYTYSGPASYMPNVTPIYDLTDDDFVGSSREDPLQVTRSDPYTAYNLFRLEISDRGNAYNYNPIETRDQNAIERFGLRIASTVTAHEICDPEIAVLSGQLMLQRSIDIRNTFKFKLSWEYCLLEPMDLVTLTDPYLGLNQAPVRITEIEEDEAGVLSVTAEEFPLGAATATRYPVGTVTNSPLLRNEPAQTVNAPIIFEPPQDLVGATPQVWIAASGGENGVVDPMWGGCTVWVSLDNVSYSQIGTISAAARQGVLTAPLPDYGGINPDTGDILSVNMAESAGVLASATALDAELANTLCIVDRELVSYATSTLTSASNYALTGLYRGLYGSTPVAHSPGAPFARLDQAIFEYDLSEAYIGQPLWFKFQSFNVFGSGVQDISTCVAYPYTPQGSGLLGPVAQALAVGTNLDYGLASALISEADDFGLASDPYVTLIDLGLASA